MKKWFQTLTLVGLISIFPTVAFADTPSFKDIPTDHVYHDIIVDMANRGIINGYEDGTFKPEQSISRQHAAALINRAVDLPKVQEFTQPNDLTTKNAYYNDLKALIEADLLQLDNKGNIHPNAPLKRSEMAKILVVAFDLTGSTPKTFTDVPISHKFYSHINTLYANNITTGDNGKYLPEKTLSRAHFALFMNRSTLLRGGEKISPETTLDIFNRSIKTNPLFALSKEYKANNVAWDEIEYRLAVTEGQQLLEGTEFKFKSIAPFIYIEEPTWENKYARNFLSAQIGILVTNERVEIAFDHTDNDTVEMAIKFANLLFVDIDLEPIIREKITEGLESIMNGNIYFDNTNRLNINDYNVQIGVTTLPKQYTYFSVDVTKR